MRSRVPYRNNGEVKTVLEKYHATLYVFVSPQNRSDRRAADIIIQQVSKALTHFRLVQLFMESQGAKDQNRCSEQRERDRLPPKRSDAGSLEKKVAHNLHEVAQRVQIGQILHRIRHIADRKGKAAQEQCGHEEKKRRHHRLLLGLRNGGYEEADSQG